MPILIPTKMSVLSSINGGLWWQKKTILKY
jgi:hypothetical protein